MSSSASPGSTRTSPGYLTDEVLARQHPDVQRFLFATSVLERMNGSLCDAVTGGSDGHAMLDWLERQSLFVDAASTRAASGSATTALFRDLLLHRLRASGLDRRTFLRRAADWHVERDDPEAAADHLIAGRGLGRRAGASPASTAALPFEQGRAATALRWIDAVPASVRGARRDVGFQRVAIEMMVGSSLAAEEHLHQLEDQQPFTLGEQVLADTFRAGAVEAHVPPDTALDRWGTGAPVAGRRGSRSRSRTSSA